MQCGETCLSLVHVPLLRCGKVAKQNDPKGSYVPAIEAGSVKFHAQRIESIHV